MENESTLIGQFLVAMPSLTDPRFEKSVILITSHNPEGATGLIINKPFHTNLNNIINKIGVSDEISRDDIDVLNGGPVDTDKGIILHNSEFTSLGVAFCICTRLISRSMSLTCASNFPICLR